MLHPTAPGSQRKTAVGAGRSRVLREEQEHRTSPNTGLRAAGEPSREPGPGDLGQPPQGAGVMSAVWLPVPVSVCPGPAPGEQEGPWVLPEHVSGRRGPRASLPLEEACEVCG